MIAKLLDWYQKFHQQLRVLTISSLSLCLIHAHTIYAVTCEDVNERLAMTKLFIDKSVLLQAQQDRIVHVLMSHLDPLKIYFQYQDYEYITSQFGFVEIGDNTMKVDCSLLDEIAQLFNERVKYSIKLLENLNYNEIKHGPDRAIQFYYEHDDYAKNNKEAEQRLLNRARLESFLLEFSNIVKSHTAKEHLVLKTIHGSMIKLHQFYDITTPRGHDQFYNLFIQAVFVAIDRDITYFDDRTMSAIRSMQYISKLRGTSLKDDQAKIRSDTISNFIGSLLTITRNWEEPFWRISSVHDSHNEVALKDDLFKPGDILFAISVGKSGTLLDLGYSANIAELFEHSSEPNHSQNTKRKKIMITLRKLDNNTTEVRAVSFSQKGAGLPMETGFLPFTVHHQDLSANFDLAYVKILTFPNDYNALITSKLGKVDTLLRNLVATNPDVITLDLRFNNPLENGHSAWQSVQELMSAFLPEGVSLGYVRERFTDGREEAYLLETQQPDYLSDEDYHQLLNTPLVVLTSYQSREYHEWVAQILKYYRRALIIGDAFTSTKDTVNSEATSPKLNFHANLPGIRLYTPGGQNFSADPLLTDVIIPSFMSSEKTIDIRYPENTYDDSLNEFNPTPLDDSFTDWLPDHVVDTLVARSARRVNLNENLMRYQQIEEQIGHPEVMRFRPLRMLLDYSKVHQVHSNHITPAAPDRGTSATGSLMWAQKILELDHTAAEAFNITADYFISLTETPLPDQIDWQLSPHPRLTPKPKPKPQPPKPSKHKGKGARSGGFGS